MNEQIKHLGQEAGLTFIEDGVHGQRWYDSKCGMDQAELEKFANLIVQECINLLMQPEYIMSGVPKLSRYNQGWVNGRLLGVEHIKDHFGIK